MPDSVSKPVPAWKEFEELVARIEETAAPRNAIVKSPDQIADIVTGTKRQVDASIRYLVGSVPILITVECKKRSRRQDVTWIEGLVTKPLTPSPELENPGSRRADSRTRFRRL